jgi:glutathione peroxidase-family protein
MICPADKVCELKCQLCEQYRAIGTIKNKYNGKEFKVCKKCLDLVVVKKGGNND